MLSYGEDPESLSHLALNAYRVVTDGQTDRIPIANTRSQQYLPVQLSRVKIVKIHANINNDVLQKNVSWTTISPMSVLPYITSAAFSD